MSISILLELDVIVLAVQADMTRWLRWLPVRLPAIAVCSSEGAASCHDNLSELVARDCTLGTHVPAQAWQQGSLLSCSSSSLAFSA